MKTTEYEVDIPKSAGRAGFLKAIEAILKLPRVQEIHIDAKGRVTCTQAVESTLPVDTLQIDLEILSPYNIIRNSSAVELDLPTEDSAPVMAAKMFAFASSSRLYPICFVSGVNTNLWKWYASSGLTLPPFVEEEEFMGFPLYRDKAVEDYVLFLCTGQFRGASLTENYRALKILIPEVK